MAGSVYRFKLQPCYLTWSVNIARQRTLTGVMKVQLHRKNGHVFLQAPNSCNREFIDVLSNLILKACRFYFSFSYYVIKARISLHVET